MQSPDSKGVIPPPCLITKDTRNKDALYIRKKLFCKPLFKNDSHHSLKFVHLFTTPTL